MKLLVIDGQGGGIGKRLVSALKEQLPAQPVMALGTNALATAAMLKSGADQGATGENAICHQCLSADVIAGVTGILHANAMLGEITPAMAAAISGSEALKVLIPLDRCGIKIVGVRPMTLDEAIKAAAEEIIKIIGGDKK